MRIRPPTCITALLEEIPLPRWFRRPQDLRRKLEDQFTEDYWRRRTKVQSHRFQFVKYRYRLGSFVADAREGIGIVLGTIISLLRSFFGGMLLIGLVLVAEILLSHYVTDRLMPAGEPLPSALPTLAVQVSASLLGFYLASVGIVLGTSYREVSAGVRELVLGNARTRLYLASIGFAIGSGLTLVLLKSVDVSFGYMTISAYSLLLAFSGWAFIQLAFGAFNLFNPIVLGIEPLRVLYRAINRLDSKGLLGNEDVLRSTFQRTNRALGILAELIEIMSKRGKVDRDDLVEMVQYLLLHVQLYAQRKHLISPTSRWFPLEPSYQKWIEANYSEVAIALDTSMPLQPRMEQVSDWLEKRSAELAVSAIEACVVANDRDAALRITRAVASTARVLARCYRLDDSIDFSAVVRDGCRNIQSKNSAAEAVTAEPPLLLTDMLLGWREAIASWPDEVREVVASTAWDRPMTAVVQIRGPARVRTAAQRLLKEVEAEHEIEGHRVTPDWYLRSALAGECILSLREFADQLPGILDDYFTLGPLEQSLPTVKATSASQALQTLAKAEYLVDTIPQVVDDLNNLQQGIDPQVTEEFESLRETIQTRRSRILERLAEAVTKLQPERALSKPDLFGEALFTLVHHIQQAIESGDTVLVGILFNKILYASLIMEGYVAATYRPPTYQLTSATFDPMIDLLELSGLALIYEVLRDDKSADPIRNGWVKYIHASKKSEDAAKRVLDILDLVDGNFSFGMSPRSNARTGWGMRLSKHIVEAGYAVPDYNPFDDLPTWSAPPLIKMLSVMESLPTIDIHPRAFFAAQVIGPLSGETEEELRERPALRRYYEARDHDTEPDISKDFLKDDTENSE